MKEIKHSQYLKYNKIMTRAKDCYRGQDEVKAKGHTYLPMLPGMKAAPDGQELYELYLTNSLFYPAVGKTIDAFTGILFRKKPTVGGGDNVMTDNITYDGKSLDQVATECAQDLMLNYRCAILVDYPDVNTEGMTQAEVASFDIRPYFSFYEQTTIIDWNIDYKNGLGELTRVILSETIKQNDVSDPDAVIKNGVIESIRILTLENNVYWNRLYYKAKVKGEEDWKLHSEKSPIMNNKFLNFIPITPCSNSGGWDIDYPMINDLVNMNLADYRNEALYRDCLLFTGRPTPCVSGLIIDENQSTMSMGSSTIWQFRDGGSSWVLGGDVAATSALKQESDALKRQMATIGARSLASDSTVQEAAETASIRRAGESGILSVVAKAVNRCITKSLQIAMEWAGNDPKEYYYQLSTDYVSTKIDVVTLQAIFAQYLQGEIPLSIFYNALDKSELLPEDMNIDKFIEERDKDKAEKIPSGTMQITTDEVINGLQNS